jgi:hypothetical protein
MIFRHRRFLMLFIMATLVTGAAFASQNLAGFYPVTGVSGHRLPARADSASHQRLSANNAVLKSTPAQTQSADPSKSGRREFTVYRDESGQIVCREATPDEIKARAAADLTKLGLRQINHPEFDKSVNAQTPAATGLVIILRATQQLQQNAAATAAFNRAAQNWENVIMSPITIYIDVDFGPTDFGQSWPSGVLGATGSPSNSYPYQSVRGNLIAEAAGEGNATKQAIFNALPGTAVPTDSGDASGVDVQDSNARAIGLLPATAEASDDAAQIAFNSGFIFDFDPSNGIGSNAIDFDAVSTHEIGHALGFDSDAGMNEARPATWDLYRFRTGTTSSTFATAQRILTIGGSPDPLQFEFIPGNTELGLANGGPDGSTTNGGDGDQSSHWKAASSCNGAIGIMDPAIPNGCRRTITGNDTTALAAFGYNLTNNNPPPPPPAAPTPPPNDNFANAQAITGCSGTATGTTFGATNEAGEPSHDPTDNTAGSPDHTIWFKWTAPSSSSTTITTAGSDFDTILAVYTGSALNSLSRLTFNDDVQDGVIRTSSVTFNATIGTVYWIAVDGWGGDEGAVNLNWTASGCVAPSPTPTPTPANPIDDPTFFVKQHYLDFLNRQADQSGLAFWVQQITSCGSDAQCIEVQRVNTSGAFFLSIEFQQTGALVYKMYKAGFGNLQGTPVAVTRAPFIADTQQIQSTPGQVIVGQGNWQAQLETNKQAFALAFVQRALFQTQHATQAADVYVNSLFSNTGASPTPAEVTAAINAFNSAGGGDAGRAAALRSVAESNSVTTQLNNEAFVLMQYFGYLQRNPNDPPDADYSGFNFWLGKLNQFNGDFIAAEMVKAFIDSTEYRHRFGP